MKIKAVLFDFDGVIVQSEKVHMKTFLDVLERYGIGEISEERWFKEFAGRGSKNILERLIKEVKKPIDISLDEIVEIRKRIYAKAIENGEVKLTPGILEFLNLLEEKKIKIGIVSGGHKKNILKALEKLGIKKYFSIVIGAEEVNNRKPDPEPYLKAMELFKVKPSETLIIEDSIAGSIAAKKSGARFILVDSPVKTKISGYIKIIKNFDNFPMEIFDNN